MRLSKQASLMLAGIMLVTAGCVSNGTFESKVVAAPEATLRQLNVMIGDAPSEWERDRRVRSREWQELPAIAETQLRAIIAALQPALTAELENHAVTGVVGRAVRTPNGSFAATSGTAPLTGPVLLIVLQAQTSDLGSSNSDRTQIVVRAGMSMTEARRQIWTGKFEYRHHDRLASQEIVEAQTAQVKETATTLAAQIVARLTADGMIPPAQTAR